MRARSWIERTRAVRVSLLCMLLLACASEDDRWAKALKSDSAADYATYLSKYPDGSHRTEAQQRFDARRWLDAKAADDIEALQNYVKEFPKGAFVAAARQAIEVFPKAAVQRAARKGDLAAMRALLSNGAPVDRVEGVDVSALHIVANACNDAAVELLVSRHADVNARAADDTTPLHYAVQSGCMPVVKRLLDAGADPNLQVRPAFQAYVNTGEGTFTYVGGGKTPLQGSALHWAAAAEKREMAALLLDRKADVNAKTPRDIAPLHYAAGTGSVPMIELLLQRGASTHYLPDPAMDIGVLPGEENIISNGQAIHYAKTGGAVAALVAKGARLDEPSRYRGQPIHSVAAFGYADAVAYLLDRGVAVDTLGPWNIDAGRTTDTTAAWVAAAEGRLEMVKLLEKRGAKLDFVGSDSTGQFGGSLLHAAAMSGNVELISYLLSRGLPVDGRADMPTMFPLVTAYTNQTPLGVAAHRGHVEAMRVLVKAGADPNASADEGRSPLKVAMFGRSLEAVRFLLDQNVPIPYDAATVERLNTSDEMIVLLTSRLGKGVPTKAATAK